MSDRIRLSRLRLLASLASSTALGGLGYAGLGCGCEHHHLGSFRMGDAPATSVVNADLRANGPRGCSSSTSS